MSDSKHDSNEEFEAPVSLHCVVLEDGVNVEEHIVGVFDVNGLIMIRSLDRKLLRGKKVALTRSRLFRLSLLSGGQKKTSVSSKTVRCLANPQSQNPKPDKYE